VLDASVNLSSASDGPKRCIREMMAFAQTQGCTRLIRPNRASRAEAIIEASISWGL